MAIHEHRAFAPSEQRTIATVDRLAIEAEIERLISLLDLYDGECDLEDDDPAGGNVEDEPQHPDHFPMLPRYGINQTRVLNEKEIMHHAMIGARDDAQAMARRAAA